MHIKLIFINADVIGYLVIFSRFRYVKSTIINVLIKLRKTGLNKLNIFNNIN